jgi:Ni/Co efflux regulator RcnB
MLRNLTKLAFLTILAVAGVAGIVAYHQSRDVKDERIAELKREKQQLEQIVERLSSERRIAQVLVTEQHRDDKGVLHTTLLLVEETKAGRTLPPKRITVRGDHVYIDALVIKFEENYIKDGDALRGQSIALFDKVFGSAEKPADATRIDEPGRIPEIYRGADVTVSDYEQALWREFWRLAEDQELARTQGVRVAQGQSVYGPLKPDLLYTMTIKPDGNIDMTAAPVPAVFREAMRKELAS